MSNDPVKDAETKISLWISDPAKMVFRIVSTVMAAAGALAVLLVKFADVLPVKYQATAATVLGVCTAIAVVGTKVTTWLIAHGYGPASNGKNGAWSPLSNYAAVEHAQTMSVRKGGNVGAELPGAPKNG